MKLGFTGLESSGKSQLMAVLSCRNLDTAIRYIKKRKKMGLPFVPRTMAHDSPMCQAYIDKCNKWGIPYIHFYNLTEILHLNEVDIHINEINKFFPARGSEPLTREQTEFLTQGAKDGVDIYFCSQDFSQTHKQFRYLVNELHLVVKVFGSRRPSRSTPPVKFIYGLVLHWAINPRTFKGDNMTMERETYMPSFYLINREDTELYDTSYKVRGSQLPPIKMAQQDVVYIDNEGTEVKRLTKWTKK